jgi:membrane-bound lytic murein transglycosylase F
VTFFRSPADALQAVLDGRADLAAAGLTAAVGEGRARLSTPIDRVGAQLVYRMGGSAPRSASDLSGRLVVAKGGDYEARLRKLQRDYPNLRWEVSATMDAEELLLEVAKGKIDYSVAASSLVAIQQRYYPQLRVAFEIGKHDDVAFAFAPGRDNSFYQHAQHYLQQIPSKSLARLHDRYYGHVEEVDYYSAVTIATRMRSRLPNYRGAFQRSAERHQLDWRLLAAVGYQESHWNPAAESYTGVRGLMMLTQDTAKRYGIANREDPIQSIEGGARVLADLYKKLPPGIQEPDRSWMVLAAYNQGLGHLLDARALAKERGGDSNHWVDVRDAYPLLTRPRWYQRARYGYVRGNEAVDFVANVRSYYDIIAWLSSGAPQLPPPILRFDPELRPPPKPAGSPAEAAPQPPPAAGIELMQENALNSLRQDDAAVEEPAPLTVNPDAAEKASAVEPNTAP